MPNNGVFNILGLKNFNFEEKKGLKSSPNTEKENYSQSYLTALPRQILYECKMIFSDPLENPQARQAFVQFTLSSVFKMAGCRHVWYGCIGYCLLFHL